LPVVFEVKTTGRSAYSTGGVAYRERSKYWVIARIAMAKLRGLDRLRLKHSGVFLRPLCKRERVAPQHIAHGGQHFRRAAAAHNRAKR